MNPSTEARELRRGPAPGSGAEAQMNPRIPLLLAALLLALAGPAAARTTVHVKGRAVDERGRPLTAYEIGSFWSWDEGEPENVRPLRVNRKGGFSGEVTIRQEFAVLIAYASRWQLAGMVRVTADQTEDLVVTLRPSARVTARVRWPELGEELLSCGGYWMVGKERPVYIRSKKGELTLPLPAGDWSYDFYDEYMKHARGTVELEPSGVHDLGLLELPAAYIAQHRGQVIEDWRVTEAKGIALEDASLSRLRGKWLLVEFWGYW